MADNQAVYFEYNSIDVNYFFPDVDYVTLGYRYEDRWLVDASYSYGISFGSGELKYPSDVNEKSQWLNATVGYNIIKNDLGSFGIIVGYSDLNLKFSRGVEYEKFSFNTFGVGVQSVIRADAFSCSLKYLIGISDGLDAKHPEGEMSIDADASMLQIKMGYDFSDSWQLYLDYRSIKFDLDREVSFDFSGIGLGVQYRF